MKGRLLKMDSNRNIIINDKTFIITTNYNDEIYGNFVKAITTELKNFERIYLKKEGNNYVKITDEKVLAYIKEKYESVSSDLIL